MTAIYPHNRWLWAFCAIFATVMAVFGLSVGALGGWNWLVACASFLFFGWLGLVAWRQVLRPRPVVILDPEGVECTEGRLAWGDVQRVIEVRKRAQEGDHVWLLFVGRAGTEPLSPAGRYFARVGVGGLYSSRGGLRLPKTALPVLVVNVSASMSRAQEALGRYYAQPITVIASSALEATLAAA